jgi:predicted MPP superfamily phosphohydrolase
MRRGIKKSDLVIIWMIRLIPVVALIWFIWAQNNMILSLNYTYENADLPKAFVGYRITHVSDLCNTGDKIVSKIKKENPDVIVLTGGYSDSNGKYSESVKIVNKLTKIAPVYYIYNMNDAGNELADTSATNITDSVVQLNTTESNADDFIEKYYGKRIKEKADSGDEEAQQYIEYVTSELANTAGSTIDLIGLGKYDYDKGIYDAEQEAINLRGTDLTRMSILLNSNINNLELISKDDIDMILFGGTFGTNLISDEYTKGKYGLNGTELFVSGGIGNITDTSRFINFPQIQTIELSDRTVVRENPLEKFIGIFVKDVGNIFENDNGFQEYRKTYDSYGVETDEAK